MEKFAYQIGKEVCGRLPFHFSPCSTTDSRLLLGYCLMAVGVAAIIVMFFYGNDRPHAGR